MQEPDETPEREVLAAPPVDCCSGLGAPNGQPCPECGCFDGGNASNTCAKHRYVRREGAYGRSHGDKPRRGTFVD